MNESICSWRRRHRLTRGQSIVEFALMMPVLLIILSGLFEFGFIFTQYLAVLDAARNSARFSSDSQFDITDGDTDCDTTHDFFRQAACLAVRELASEQPTIELCLPGSTPREHCDGTTWEQMDDVIVSIFSVTKHGHPSTQFPEIVRFPNPGIATCDEMGWSFAVDLDGSGAHSSQCAFRDGMHVSQFSKDEIEGMLDMSGPNTGFVLVEINYHYWQMLALPWFTQFVGDPIEFHLYALWPQTSAEPTSTT
jgi:hypothetical protein